MVRLTKHSMSSSVLNIHCHCYCVMKIIIIFVVINCNPSVLRSFGNYISKDINIDIVAKIVITPLEIIPDIGDSSPGRLHIFFQSNFQLTRLLTSIQQSSDQSNSNICNENHRTFLIWTKCTFRCLSRCLLFFSCLYCITFCLGYKTKAFATFPVRG